MQRGVEQRGMHAIGIGLLVVILGQADLGEHVIPEPPRSAQPLERGPVVKTQPSQIVIESLDIHDLRTLRGPHRSSEHPNALAHRRRTAETPRL